MPKMTRFVPGCAAFAGSLLSFSLLCGTPALAAEAVGSGPAPISPVTQEEPADSGASPLAYPGGSIDELMAATTGAATTGAATTDAATTDAAATDAAATATAPETMPATTAAAPEGAEPQAHADGWAHEDGVWRYYEGGKAVAGFRDLPNRDDASKGTARYWFEADGALASYKAFYDKATDGWYWADADGTVARNKDAFVPATTGSKDSKWVRLDANGKMLKGQDYRNGAWYYFDPTTSAMAKGFAYVVDGKKWCYFDPTTGKMQYGEKYADGKWVYLDDHTGAVQYGFRYMASQKKWVFYQYGSGAMAHGEVYVDGSHGDTPGWCLFDKYTGAMQYGFQKIGNKWVYYNSVTGRMVYGDVKINGATYSFDKTSGAAIDKVGYQVRDPFYKVSVRNVTLPSYAGGKFAYVTPSRISMTASRSEIIETFIQRAYEYLGTPYKWNYSLAPGVGVDCSGLVMQCMCAVGMRTPYNSYDHMYDPWQDHNAENMRADSRLAHVSLNDRQRGDLIFYPGHVAIYLGNDQVINATTLGNKVQIQSMWSFGLSVTGVARPFL